MKNKIVYDVVYEAHGFYGELGEFDIDKCAMDNDQDELNSNQFHTIEEAKDFVIEEYNGIIQYYQNLINKLKTNGKN